MRSCRMSGSTRWSSGLRLGVHGRTRAMVAVAAQARRSLVLDADALTSFEGLASELHKASARPRPF